MRLLLVAYEFPPSPSPQSLRWAYLARELARAGHEVHVLAPDLGWQTPGLPELPPELLVHRTVAGPISGAMALLARRQAAKAARRAGQASPSEAGQAAPAPTGNGAALQPVRESRLNWKGRLVERLKGMAQRALFPDSRGEWRRPARRAALELVERLHPDVLITSHEPATPLEVGLAVKRRFPALPWLADLGDPVLADYTPPRWQRRAAALERQVIARADLVTVTAPGTRDLLRQRHGSPAGTGGAIEVLTQGFEDRPGTLDAPAPQLFDRDRLELLYTGSFYRFRRPDALLDAIERVPAARLNIASVTIPEWLWPRLEANPAQFRPLGFLPHRGVLALQRHADVLVNLANDNPCQVPGKLYEYLGAARPILHVKGPAGDDVPSALIAEHRRGWACEPDSAAIVARLETLAAQKRTGQPIAAGLDMGDSAVSMFGWSQLAHRLAELLAALPAGRPALAQALSEQGH